MEMSFVHRVLFDTSTHLCKTREKGSHSVNVIRVVAKTHFARHARRRELEQKVQRHAYVHARVECWHEESFGRMSPYEVDFAVKC